MPSDALPPANTVPAAPPSIRWVGVVLGLTALLPAMFIQWEVGSAVPVTLYLLGDSDALDAGLLGPLRWAGIGLDAGMVALLVTGAAAGLASNLRRILATHMSVLVALALRVLVAALELAVLLEVVG